ncbi:hypothetical protein ES703_121632 [subsurface metagenome]
MKKQKNYDKKVRQTRILLSDYLILKSIAQKAGVSMSQALHRLIEHQAQLPLLDRIARPVSVIATQPGLSGITAKSVPALRTALVTSIATNGSKLSAFRIKTGRVKYD